MYRKIRRQKNCFAKQRVILEELKEKITEEEIVIFNWKHVRLNQKQPARKMKDLEIRALQKGVKKLKAVYTILDKNFKNEQQCENALKDSKEFIKEYRVLTKQEMENWKVEKWILPRDDYFYFKYHDLLVKSEITRYFHYIFKLIVKEYTKDVR